MTTFCCVQKYHSLYILVYVLFLLIILYYVRCILRIHVGVFAFTKIYTINQEFVVTFFKYCFILANFVASFIDNYEQLQDGRADYKVHDTIVAIYMCCGCGRCHFPKVVQCISM